MLIVFHILKLVYTIMINYINTNNSYNLIEMSALLFPGQGSQVVGIGLSFIKALIK